MRHVCDNCGESFVFKKGCGMAFEGEKYFERCAICVERIGPIDIGHSFIAAEVAGTGLTKDGETLQ